MEQLFTDCGSFPLSAEESVMTLFVCIKEHASLSMQFLLPPLSLGFALMLSRFTNVHAGVCVHSDVPVVWLKHYGMDFNKHCKFK